jgi:predicted phosphodiesterase
MKTIVVSDLHLSHRFDRVRCEYLESLFAEADQVIINGDFWDNHATTFDHFVRSKWQRLFPLLLAKRSIYIFGNHDRRRDSDERVTLFSVKQTDQHELRSGKLRLHIEHGHLLLDDHQDAPDWVVSLFRTAKYDYWFRTPVENVLVNQNNDLLHRWHMGDNQQEMMVKAAQRTDVHLVVTGHTHLPHFSPDQKYANIGYINHGIAYYLIVEDGKAWYVKERYRPIRQIQEKTSLLIE